MQGKSIRYVEFATASNFSFLRGASHPEELMLQASAMGLAGLGLTDRNSVAGVVRAHVARREHKLPLAYHPGARLVFADGTPDILAYPRDRAGWANLCRLLTRGNLRAEKGDCILALADLIECSDHLELIVMETSSRGDAPPRPKTISETPACSDDAPANDRPTDAVAASFGLEDSPPGTMPPSPGGTSRRHEIAQLRRKRGSDPVKLAVIKPPLPDPPPHGGREQETVPPAHGGRERKAVPPAHGGRERETVPSSHGRNEREALSLPHDFAPGRAPKRPMLTVVAGHESDIKGGRHGARTEKPASAPDRTRDPTRDGERDLLLRLRTAAPGRLRLAAVMHHRGDDRARLLRRAALARAIGVPLIAVNDVLYHHHDRRALQDVVTCIREHLTLDQAGRKLAVNAERYLKPPAEMARLFAGVPEAIAETLALDAALTFSLDELRYEYPDETVAGFATPQEALEHLAWEGARTRYPGGVSDAVRRSLAHEFALIRERNYAPYFLTVYDIVRYARSIGVLCQGRGSAANSTVCYCLGVTSVDPVASDLLFERFISTERDEPPDIDVDFEHERREEVIQYIYRRYGRARAGIAGTVISYRGRSAIREVGKAFGLSEDTIGALASSIWGMGGGNVRAEEFARAGIDLSAPRVAKMRALAAEIQSFPRHLSQHVGGFVITRSRLDEVVPIMNGAMDERTHVEWDKDDLDALGILKVDVLGLGMLTCIRKAFELIETHYGASMRLPMPEAGRALSHEPCRKPAFDLARVPADETAVYDMLCRADSVGVFQVESRAQMSMLPRLKPRVFYDLVIEVAIVRPGPIQGDMVHPYLRRRLGQEKVDYVKPELEAVLKKTLGVPLFQEQAMKIAIVAGGFTPGEADKLRRAMATFKRTGTIGHFRARMIAGMVARGYPQDFAERCFSQIEGFGGYGFPESHAASFALLVYASAWLKCRYPDAFAAALLNSQPMGFYAPAQIVRDMREHGVEVRPVDVNHSDWDATLEPDDADISGRLHELHRDMARDIRTTHAIRLGLRKIKGLKAEDARKIVSADKPFTSVRDLWLRTGLPQSAIERLADADAFGSLGLSRREALWAAKALGRVGDRDDDLPLFRASAKSPSHDLTSLPDPPPQGGREREVLPPSQGKRKREPLPPPEEEREREVLPPPQGATTNAGFAEPAVALPRMTAGEEVVNDYRFLALSLRAHPATFLRGDLARRRVIPNADLRRRRTGERVRVSGLVTIRQRPGSAAGVVFMTIEDETAIANIIVWPNTFERFRPIILGARYIGVEGPVQQESGVIHVVAERLVDLTGLLARLAEDAPPIESLSRADGVKHPHDETVDSRARGRRNPPVIDAPRLLTRPPDIFDNLAGDLDVPARGSAHAPGKRGGSRVRT